MKEDLVNALEKTGWVLSGSWDNGLKLYYSNPALEGFGVFLLEGEVNSATMIGPLKKMDELKACLNFSYNIKFRINPFDSAKLARELPKNTNVIIAAVEVGSLAGWVNFFMRNASGSGDFKSAFKSAETSGNKPIVLLRFRTQFGDLIKQFNDLAKGVISELPDEPEDPDTD